jgi:hypothetical protein
MPLGPQIVTYGNVQSTFILTISITPVATTNAATVEQSFTVPGLQVGDQVSALTALFAFTSLVDIINARVSAANTLTLAFSNNTAGSLTYPAGSFYLEVNRPVAGLTMTGIQ